MALASSSRRSCLCTVHLSFSETTKQGFVPSKSIYCVVHTDIDDLGLSKTILKALSIPNALSERRDIVPNHESIIPPLWGRGWCTSSTFTRDLIPGGSSIGSMGVTFRSSSAMNVLGLFSSITHLIFPLLFVQYVLDYYMLAIRPNGPFYSVFDWRSSGNGRQASS